MRVAAIALVVLGAIMLGIQSFGSLPQGRAAPPGAGANRTDTDSTVWAIPVVSGIAMVGGLLLLVSDTRRE